jgi:hypothetical protein
MAASKDRVRITIEGPRDQLQFESNYYTPPDYSWPAATTVIPSLLESITVSTGLGCEVSFEILKPPAPPKVYTYWQRITSANSFIYTQFRVDEDGQWQIFREDAWQDCIYIRSLEDLAHRAFNLRKSGFQ